METKPTRPRKAKRRKPTLPQVSKPETLEVTKLEPALEPPKNMHAKTDKIGKPTIGRGPNYVETVGLGNLKVITANGRNSDV